MKQSFHFLLLSFCVALCSPLLSAVNTEYTFSDSDQKYQYSVTQTGENYTFKFVTPPKDPVTKLKAGKHVLLSIYHDSSINNTYTEDYIRERARCFVFDSHFYTYSLCFLPNDFDKKNNDRFWGFVSQVPNWKWLVSRLLFPVILVFAGFLYVGRRKKL